MFGETLNGPILDVKLGNRNGMKSILGILGYVVCHRFPYSFGILNKSQTRDRLA
jgi:hypothetical protein